MEHFALKSSMELFLARRARGHESSLAAISIGCAHLGE